MNENEKQNEELDQPTEGQNVLPSQKSNDEKQNYEYHELANFFPMMNDDESRSLTADIKENGLLNPIALYEGKIIDGRNRYQACIKAGVGLRFTEINPPNVFKWIISQNLERRHLNKTQLAVIANNIANYNQGRPEKSGSAAALISQKEASEFLGIGERILRSVKKIEREAPEKIAEMRSGEKSVEEVIKEIKKEKKQTAKQEFIESGKAVTIKNELVDIRLGDFNKVLADIPDNSVDLILTDPPYPYEFINCWSEIGEFAERKLKDGGFLIAYSGHQYLPEVLNRVLESGMKWYWLGSCLHTGAGLAQVFSVNVFAGHKPILFFYKGNKHKQDEWFNDVFESKDEETKDFHKWGQTVDIFDEIIKIFRPSVVVDPFLGGGTTAIACMMNGVKCIGAELEEDSYMISKKRIDDYGK